MKMRILAALLAILLLLATFSSCQIPELITDFLGSSLEETTAETTPKQEVELPPVIDGSFFEAHFIDVGQADCMLIICDGQAMLIDAGNPDDDDIIIDYLAEHNIGHISYVIATHPHSDHYGAFTSVLRHVTVDTVYSPFAVTDVSGFNKFINYLDSTTA